MRCQDGAVDRRNVRTDLQDQLNADLVKAGYYPVLVQGVLDVALAGEEVRAYLVHPETTFDAREVRRHLTALALTPTRLVMAHVDELDEAIALASDHWSIDRMPVIDRAVIRLGLYELRYVPGTPAAVIVNEAVRLAKTYSTQRSGVFVNGVLAALAETERP